MKTLKINTWCPLFWGLYECPYFDGALERELENFDVYFEDIEDSYNWQYEANIFTEEFTDKLENELVQLGYIEKINFQKVVSPKFYNYSTDEINVSVTLSPFNQIKINKTITDNWSEFEDYIKEKYTSRSGFISHYENDASLWIEGAIEDEHKLGSILEFILSIEGIEADDIYQELEYIPNISAY